MVCKSEKLSRFARELAALPPEERTWVITEAMRQARFYPPPPGWRPPLLTGGKAWDEGSLRRENLYGDEGR